MIPDTRPPEPRTPAAGPRPGPWWRGAPPRHEPDRPKPDAIYSWWRKTPGGALIVFHIRRAVTKPDAETAEVAALVQALGFKETPLLPCTHCGHVD